MRYVGKKTWKIAILFALAIYLRSLPAIRAEEKQDAQTVEAADLEAQLKALESIGNPTPCQKAVLTALRNDKVRDLFLAKIKNHCYRLKDICCLGIPHIPEHEYVLFDFDCAPPCFCIVDPQFLVVVDTIEKKVVAINDPYSGPAEPCRSIRDSAAGPHGVADEAAESADIIDGVVSGCDVIKDGNDFRIYAFITDPSTGNEVQVTSRYDAFHRVLLAASDMQESNINQKKPLVEVEYGSQSPHEVRRIRVLDR